MAQQPVESAAVSLLGTNRAPPSATTAQAFGAGLGQSIAEFGEHLGELGARMLDSQRESKILDAKLATSQSINKLHQQFQQNPDQDAGWADYQTGIKALIETVPDQFTNNFFGAEDSVTRERVTRDTLNAAEVSTQQVFGQYWQRTTTENRQKVFTQLDVLEKQRAQASTPEEADKIKAETLSLLQTSRHWFSKGEQEKLQVQRLSKYDEIDARTIANVNLRQGLEMLEATDEGTPNKGTYSNFKDLDPDKRQELIYQYQRQLGMFGKDDHFAQLVDQVMAQGYKDGKPITPDITAAWARYGVSDAKQEELRKYHQYALSMRDSLTKWDNASIQDRNQILSDLQAKADSPNNVDAHYAKAALSYASQELQAKTQQMQQDPAAYASAVVPPRPGASTQEIISERAAYQSHVGLPITPYTNQEVAGLKQTFLTGNPALAVNLLEKVKQESGNFEGAAVKQLRSTMPPLFFALEPGKDELNGAIINTTRAQAKGDLPKIPPDKAESLQTLVGEKLKAIQGDTNMPLAQRNQISESITQLAQGLYPQFNDAGKAVDKAYSLLWGSQYKTKGNVTYSSNLNEAEERKLRNVTQDIGFKMSELPLMGGGFGADRIGNANDLASNGKWAPVGSNGSYELRDSGGNVALLKDGTPIRFNAADVPRFASFDAEAQKRNQNLASVPLLSLIATGNKEWTVDPKKFTDYLHEQAEAEKQGAVVPISTPGRASAIKGQEPATRTRLTRPGRP